MANRRPSRLDDSGSRRATPRDSATDNAPPREKSETAVRSGSAILRTALADIERFLERDRAKQAAQLLLASAPPTADNQEAHKKRETTAPSNTETGAPARSKTTWILNRATGQLTHRPSGTTFERHTYSRSQSTISGYVIRDSYYCFAWDLDIEIVG